jgi:hypothetical protein
MTDSRAQRIAAVRRERGEMDFIDNAVADGLRMRSERGAGPR